MALPDQGPPSIYALQLVQQLPRDAAHHGPTSCVPNLCLSRLSCRFSHKRAQVLSTLKTFSCYHFLLELRIISSPRLSKLLKKNATRTAVASRPPLTPRVAALLPASPEALLVTWPRAS